MRYYIITLLLLTCIFNSVDAEERVQIPLPGLHGSYCDTQVESRVDSFDLQTLMPVFINKVWITVEGYMSPGFYECLPIGIPIDRPYHLRLTAIIPDTATGGVWKAFIGNYMWTPIEFISEDGASWNFLMSNIGDITLVISHDAMSCSGDNLNIYIPACAGLINAFLEVEGCFLVAVESSTWKSIKILFR